MVMSLSSLTCVTVVTFSHTIIHPVNRTDIKEPVATLTMEFDCGVSYTMIS